MNTIYRSRKNEDMPKPVPPGTPDIITPVFKPGSERAPPTTCECRRHRAHNMCSPAVYHAWRHSASAGFQALH